MQADRPLPRRLKAVERFLGLWALGISPLANLPLVHLAVRELRMFSVTERHGTNTELDAAICQTEMNDAERKKLAEGVGFEPTVRFPAR